MQAFHGKQEIKDFYIARVRAHAIADEIQHGFYWEKGKGCAVGCTVHSSNHSAYETELGIPSVLAKLEDSIFESLSNGRAKLWPEQFLAAPKAGADLSLVWPQLAIWLMVDPQFGVLQFAKSRQSKKAIQGVADAYRKVVDGNANGIDWLKLRNAASAASAVSAASAASAAASYDDDAASYAASAASYAYAAAASAAASYDDDAASYAASAASYAYAAAASAKRQEWRNAQADKLIELMAAAE